MAGFTQRGGVFTVPYDGVYEFGVSLRLDVSFKIRSSLTSLTSTSTEVSSEVISVSSGKGSGSDRSHFELTPSFDPGIQAPLGPRTARYVIYRF